VAVALYTGSFDPIHIGHLGLVRQAAQVFDEVVIAVLGNPSKVGMFSKADRVRLVEASTMSFANVRTLSHDGMAVDAAEAVNADCIVRSAHKEHRDERTMAAMNKALAGIPTVFLQPAEDTAWISSTFVRLAVANALLPDLRAVVPAPVAAVLEGTSAHR
jgi:pantetheine-phosphate adenylyltransferase